MKKVTNNSALTSIIVSGSKIILPLRSVRINGGKRLAVTITLKVNFKIIEVLGELAIRRKPDTRQFFRPGKLWKKSTQQAVIYYIIYVLLN